MIKLTEETEKNIQALLFRANAEFNAYETVKSIDTLKEGINLLPAAPEECHLRFSLVSQICTRAYVDGLLDVVDEWLPVYLKCDEMIDGGYGNSEFLVAKLAFDRENFDKAKEYFTIADKKSTGRVWKGEKNVKYFQFFKKK